MFTRLLYYGMAHLSLRMEEVWLMPFGLLMDLWECHRQFLGLDGMSEFSCLHENEGYEVHEDEGRRCGPWRTILA